MRGIQIELVGVHADAYSPGLTERGSRELVSYIKSKEAKRKFMAIEETLVSLGVEEISVRPVRGRFVATLNWPCCTHQGEGENFFKAVEAALDDYAKYVYFSL